MDFAREGGGERAGFGEPIVGVYPLSLQLVKPTWGAVIVGERGSVGVATDVRPEGRTIFRLSASPECGSLSLDGSRLAVSFGTTVDIYHLLTGERVERFDRSRGRITALDWAPDGESLLIGAADGKVYRWRFDRGVAELPPTEWSRRFERYVGHSTTIGAVRYHPLGRVFFSGDWDGGLSAWRDYEADGEVGLFERDPLGGEFYTRRTERISVQRPGGGEGIDALGVDRVGQRLVAGRQDGSFDVWGLRGMKHLVTQPLAGGAIYDLQVSPAGDTVATASRDGRVRVFRLTAPPTGPEIKQIAEREHPGARRLAFTSNGTLLLGDKSGKVVVVREGIF
jgi:WD40 repeat protein